MQREDVSPFYPQCPVAMLVGTLAREHVEIALKARFDDVHAGSASACPGIITRVTLT